MNKDTVTDLLEKRNIEDIVEEAMNSSHILGELFKGVSSASAKTRFASAKALRMLSEKNPRKLYPRMDFFANLLEGKNTILKWIAMDVIANLATVDTRNEFNKLFRRFYDCLHEGNLVTAAHVVDNSGRIALFKPEFRDEITEELLKIERVRLPTSECRNILIGKAIDALGTYYDKIEDKDRVVSFVKRQLNNSRNSTKAKAERFLRKFETD